MWKKAILRSSLCNEISIVSLCLFLSVAVFSSTASGGIKYAWWVKAEFAPYGDMIDGVVPIEEIDDSWVSARTINLSDMPDEDDEPDVLITLRTCGYKFECDGDYNRDGMKDKAVVGVYEDKTGKTGRFLLILTEYAPGEWSMAYLDKAEGRPGFSVLSPKETGVSWCLCMECDNCSDIVWSGDSYKAILYEDGY